jgi:hypothetical protein
LPRPPVPGDLEARILAAIPSRASSEKPSAGHSPRLRRLAAWSVAALASAAAGVLAIRFSPGPHPNNRDLNPVETPVASRAAHPTRTQSSDDPLHTTAWLKAQDDPEALGVPSFTWPIPQKPPSMVSIAFRPDLSD